MKGKFSFILLSLCILLSLAACQGGGEPSPGPEETVQGVVEPDEEVEPEESTPAVTEPEEEPEAPALDPTLSQRDRDWIEDIEVLREEYKARHLNPFYLCSEEEFDWRVDQLVSKVSKLSDEDIYYEIKAILAGMGDLHTGIVWGADALPEALGDSIYGRCFPIRVRCFDGKFYLSAYMEGYEQFAPYLLREIVAINGIDMSYLETKSMSVEKPFNKWDSEEFFPSNCRFPAFLDWAGCDYKDGYVFQILNENQEVESIETPVITSTEFSEGQWAYPENWVNLYCGRTTEEWAEYIESESGGCVYMHYYSLNTVPETMTLFDAAIAVIEEHPDCGKLVLDLRDNPGGLANRIPLVKHYAEELSKFSIEQAYVLTSGNTASAAIECTAYFQNILGAVVVGEPTGQFASFFYVEDPPTGYFELPNSQILVGTSNGWYESESTVDKYYDEDGRLYPWESTILPDVYVHQDIEDIRQGRDSVLEWVLAQ